MVEAQELSKLPGLRHGFFGRQGGVSTGIYSSLNCGLGSDDDRNAILANRAHIAMTLGLPTNQLLNVHQYHSPEVLTITEPWDVNTTPKADGMVTNVNNIGLGILTADCAPVLYADEQAGVIGASHAGWRGALYGVTDNIISSMEKLGAKRAAITAVIGPTISKNAYEIGPEFIKKFLEVDANNQQFFTPSTSQDHFMFDLPGYLVQRLKRAKIGIVTNLNICTYKDAEHFFSYRRTTHAREKDYGRQLSAISLEK